jgi:hypothetical protein
VTSRGIFTTLDKEFILNQINHVWMIWTYKKGSVLSDFSLLASTWIDERFVVSSTEEDSVCDSTGNTSFMVPA